MNAVNKSMQLDGLLHGIAGVSRDENISVTDVAADNRQVKPGTLFLALKGRTHDAREYIADAVARGAVAVCYEGEGYAHVNTSVPGFAVPRLDTLAGVIASRFFASPSAAVPTVAVTGTNGKSTCAWLVASALSALGRRSGVIGTLGSGFPPVLNSGALTTPDSVSLQRTFRSLVDDGAQTIAMEMSSHALDQHRATGVDIDVSVFTNLTRDHLDYHGSMQAYGQAKARLFSFPSNKFAVINTEDAFGRQLVRGIEDHIQCLSFGSHDAEFHATKSELTTEGLRITVKTPERELIVPTRLYGRVNVQNVVAVVAVLKALGLSLEEIATGLSKSQPAPGRMERVDLDADGPEVIVDYSHTPDSLEKALESLREHTVGKLWCVFGCGGDRDAGKRPAMGAVAERLADVVVVTDDNPRTESAAGIAGDIVAGMRKPPMIIHDREDAIAYAVENAEKRDAVLIAGKGHENNQEVMGVRVAMSDRDIATSVLGTAS